MADVIDFTAARDRSNRPNPAFVSTDENGRPIYLYWADYRVGRRTETMELWARDFEDAERQIAGIRKTLVLVGQALEQIEGDDDDELARSWARPPVRAGRIAATVAWLRDLGRFWLGSAGE